MREHGRMMKPTEVQKLAVSLPEAARICGLSRRTLENYIRIRELPARKVGRRTLVTLAALEAFLRRDHSSPVIAVRSVQ